MRLPRLDPTFIKSSRDIFKTKRRTDRLLPSLLLCFGNAPTARAVSLRSHCFLSNAVHGKRASLFPFPRTKLFVKSSALIKYRPLIVFLENLIITRWHTSLKPSTRETVKQSFFFFFNEIVRRYNFSNPTEFILFEVNQARIIAPEKFAEQELRFLLHFVFRSLFSRSGLFEFQHHRRNVLCLYLAHR